MKLIRLAALILILLTAVPSYSMENFQEIDWDNLLPNMAPLDNPFTTLTTDHQPAFQDSSLPPVNGSPSNAKPSGFSK